MPAFKINDKVYALDGLGQLSLLDALEVKRQTGMSVAAIEKAMEVFSERMSNTDLTEEERAAQAFDDESVLIGLAANIWIARRKAGETLTFEQSADVPLSEIDWISTPEDEQAAQEAAALDPATNPL